MLSILTVFYYSLLGYVLLAVVMTWIHVIRNWNDFKPSPWPTANVPFPPVTFVLAARNCTETVQNTVNSILSSCREIPYTNFKILVVTDNEGIPISGADKIIVPRDYVCKSMYKARALNYALRFFPNSSGQWILHLDEDAYPTSVGILAIFDYIAGSGKPIANGRAVFPPRPGLDNIITVLGEAQRGCTFYWLISQLKGGEPYWLNGSNLLVRSDVEQRVGWDFQDCFVGEDMRFGLEAMNVFGSGIFGWYGGTTIEQAPATTKALISQRRRWFANSFTDLKFLRGHVYMKLRRVYYITAWVAGATLALFFFPNLFGLDTVQAATSLIGIVGLSLVFVLWILRYAVGLHNDFSESSLPFKTRAGYYLSLVLVPVIEVIIGFAALSSLFSPPKTFQITTKQSSNDDKSIFD